MTTEQKEKWNLKPIVGLALVSLLICGLFFPLLITGISQVFFPYQANGEIVHLNGQAIGSNLIAQNFTLPIFFQERNESQSASGVDPDITLQQAYSQIPRIVRAARAISNATGISVDSLTNIVNQNQEGTLWIFGSPYVNVLRINLELIKNYPRIYSGFPLSLGYNPHPRDHTIRNDPLGEKGRIPKTSSSSRANESTSKTPQQTFPITQPKHNTFS